MNTKLSPKRSTFQHAEKIWAVFLLFIIAIGVLVMMKFRGGHYDPSLSQVLLMACTGIGFLNGLLWFIFNQRWFPKMSMTSVSKQNVNPNSQLAKKLVLFAQSEFVAILGFVLHVSTDVRTEQALVFVLAAGVMLFLSKPKMEHF